MRRRSALLLALSPLPGWPQPAGTPSPLLAAAHLRLGVERMAKLHLERGLLPQRAGAELDKERQRVSAALRSLSELPPRALQGLSARRQAQLAQVMGEADGFVASPPESVGRVVGDSEALAARLGFITTALSGVEGRPERGAQIDLLARAGVTVLRVGKLNFAALQAGPSNELRVGATQSLTEFSSALEALGAQSLSEPQRQELQLAQQQWLLFRAALGADGLLKSRERLADVATTTDRMAESLAAMARRA